MGFFDTLGRGVKAWNDDLNTKRERASKMKDKQLAKTFMHSTGNERVACAQELDSRGLSKEDIIRLSRS